jgi:hypothetical protein
MGTLSKRRLEDFGFDVKARLDAFRDNVGHRIEHITDDAEVRGSAFLRQFEKVPSSTWLAAAGGSVLGGLVLRVMRLNQASVFVGMLAPTFLALGMYEKLARASRI